MLEPLLAYVHLASILALFVFQTSQAALCRPEWLNAAVVQRLVRVDRLYWLAMVAVLVSGGLRVWLGPKGAAWYLVNGLLHLKLTVLVVIALLSLGPAMAYRRWRRSLTSGAKMDLPGGGEVQRIRQLVMLEAHLGALIPLAATFLARGWGH